MTTGWVKTLEFLYGLFAIVAVITFFVLVLVWVL